MKKLLISFGILVLLAALGAGGYFFYWLQKLADYAQTPFGDGATKLVDIATGTGPRKLSTLLQDAHVISDADLFYAYLRQNQLGPKLKAGEYEFSGPKKPIEIIEMLVSGQVKVYRFTVREGLRVDETLPILAASDLRLNLEKLEELSQSPEFIRKLQLPSDSLEGFLYPDTYTFSKGATEEQVLGKMASRALEEYRKALAEAPSNHPLNIIETMTLASIVEKETGAPQERPRISCVFHNRLRKGMKLQTDPTVLYAMMKLRGRFIKNITRQDLTTDHPYNTYTRYGLPPGPIASPGSEAIAAAFRPIECSDLFFVSRNDGTHIFCPDLRCHEAAVKTWQIEFFRRKTTAGN